MVNPQPKSTMQLRHEISRLQAELDWLRKQLEPENCTTIAQSTHQVEVNKPTTTPAKKKPVESMPSQTHSTSIRKNRRPQLKNPSKKGKQRCWFMGCLFKKRQDHSRREEEEEEEAVENWNEFRNPQTAQVSSVRKSSTYSISEVSSEYERFKSPLDDRFSSKSAASAHKQFEVGVGVSNLKSNETKIQLFESRVAKPEISDERNISHTKPNDIDATHRSCSDSRTEFTTGEISSTRQTGMNPVPSQTKETKLKIASSSLTVSRQLHTFPATQIKKSGRELFHQNKTAIIDDQQSAATERHTDGSVTETTKVNVRSMVSLWNQSNSPNKKTQREATHGKSKHDVNGHNAVIKTMGAAQTESSSGRKDRTEGRSKSSKKSFVAEPNQNTNFQPMKDTKMSRIQSSKLEGKAPSRQHSPDDNGRGKGRGTVPTATLRTVATPENSGEPADFLAAIRAGVKLRHVGNDEVAVATKEDGRTTDFLAELQSRKKKMKSHLTDRKR